MGLHADDAINMAIDHEAEWEEYASGSMSDYEAYEAGIINHEGYADSDQLDRVLSRDPIQTWDTVHDQLNHAMKDLELSTLRSSASEPSRGSKKQALNQAAIDNLKKPRPTCNWCGFMMESRKGKYGKFYFCTCPEQCTVSDKYWQAIRTKSQPKPKISLAEWQRRVRANQ